VENDILEIRPLRDVFAPLPFIDDFCVKEQINISFGKPHLIKKSSRYFTDSDLYYLHKIRSKRRILVETEKRREKFNIELAVFVDEFACHSFMRHLNNDIKKLREMILKYVTYIQNFFHHPSLGVRIDISLVRLDIMDTQPSDLQIHSGRSDIVLSTFCTYAKTHNPHNDDHPDHWDVGLYITGRDLYDIFVAIQGTTYNVRNYIVEGTGYHNTTCHVYSCAVVKFLQYQIETAGLRSALNAVYHIGHL